MTEERRKRQLTEDDVDAIADALEKRLLGRFYFSLGKGLWGVAWKAILAVLIGIAAYGAGKGAKW